MEIVCEFAGDEKDVQVDVKDGDRVGSLVRFLWHGRLRAPDGRENPSADRAGAYCARAASSSRATMLVILIIGFTAGPAVSL